VDDQPSTAQEDVMRARPIVVWMALATLLTWPRAAPAQTVSATPAQADRKAQKSPAEPRWFMDPSYVAFLPYANERPEGPVPDDPDRQGHFAEIQSNNHLALFPRQNSTIYERWATIPEGERAHRWSSSLTLSTTIRGHRGSSVPIQTPSIGFAGRLQYLQHTRTRATPAPPGQVAGNRGTSVVFMTGLGLVHHSNGQDGCTFSQQQRNSDRTCIPEAPGDGDAWTINVRDGSFGTNYFAATVGMTQRTIRREDESFGFARGGLLEYRFHQNFPGGGLKQQLASFYGRHEAAGQLQIEIPHPMVWNRFEHVQLTARGWARFGQDRGSHRGGSIEAAWLGFAGGIAGPFVRIYSGRDYYNIRFEERRRFLMVGVLWDHARFTRLPMN
jgi:hypothetical protein